MSPQGKNLLKSMPDAAQPNATEMSCIKGMDLYKT